ncbi:rho GTPase-activating protein 26-like isoform X2 [Liolophura sinensis]|uniref:rho GTPase-activating protein 26-like isoform X2 n=1 Tax=Liolophura sinensis TaxID=3198878 RepID=UPI0031591EC9
MGLLPLEFADCLTDSPSFREKLHEHEKELERTSKSIKTLINDGKELLNAAKCLSKAQKTFSNNLREFKFECIGSQQTDDELVIAASLQEFGRLIELIEDERDRMLSKATEQFLEPLEAFRKKQIGGAKDGKKHFDRQTAKFCQSLERYLNMKTKSQENLQEADAALEMERRHFCQESMKYVLKLQEVQEKKKFEFVEILLGFMYSWLTFYHQGHEVAKDFKPYMTDLQSKLQKTRESFDSTREEALQLMMKMLEVRGTLQALTEMKSVDQTGTIKGFTRQGYLYLLEKKALGTAWTKQYCQYRKETQELLVTPFNQVAAKLVRVQPDKLKLTKCVRRASDSIEKRFCFDVTVAERPAPLTFQALSEEDRRSWLDAMDGKEPVYTVSATSVDDSLLDDIGFNFIKKCVNAVESRGLEEQGLYRVVGVNSKVNKLTTMGLDKRKADKVVLEDVGEWETKTITSAIKSYLRNLPEPLMTFKLHDAFIAAAKQCKTLRIHDIHSLVHKLPESNFEMLEFLIGHLKKISERSDENKMTVANLGVCFGPTLMRPQEETVAAIMDIKFCNIVVEILISNYEKIFKTVPDGADISESRVIPSRDGVSSGGGGGDRGRTTPTGLNSYQQHNPTYANQSAIGTGYVQGKLRARPAGIYIPNSGKEVHGSSSSSTDSLNSSKSIVNQKVAQFQERAQSAASSPHIDGHRRSAPQPPTYCNIGVGSKGAGERAVVKSRVKVLELDSSPKVPRANRVSMFNNADHAAFSSSAKKRPSNGSITQSMTSSVTSMTGSVASSLSSSSSSSKPRRSVRTLYSCDAENESELSFEPNQIITNVRSSKEPGWLEGSLGGKTGLIPQNYVEFIN